MLFRVFLFFFISSAYAEDSKVYHDTPSKAYPDTPQRPITDYMRMPLGKDTSVGGDFNAGSQPTTKRDDFTSKEGSFGLSIKHNY